MPGAVLSEVVGLLSLGSVLFCFFGVLTTFPLLFFPLGPHAEALLPFLDYNFQIYTHAHTHTHTHTQTRARALKEHVEW